MFKFFAFSLLFVCSVDFIQSIESKYWLTTCKLSQCDQALSFCLNCFGERGCKSCIVNFRSECSICSDDIYNKNDLETIGGNQYFICDGSDGFQVKACHLYCRGQYFQSGQCVRVQNVPVCQCSADDYVFPTGSTGSPLSTTSWRPPITSQVQTTLTSNNNQILSFNGTLKLNISVTDSYQKLFGLPNGDLVRGSTGSIVQIWDIKNGNVKRNLTSVYYYSNVFGVLSNDDLVVGYQSHKTILIWDLKVTNGEPLKKIIQTNETFNCLTVLKNDDLAIGQSGPNYDIVIRDSQNGTIKRRLVGHTHAVYQIIILPNENLISCSYETTVKIWNISNSSPIKSILHSTVVYSITLLKNGYLASGLSDGRIEIHNLETGDLIRVLTGHNNGICHNNCLHVLDNGNLLSGSYDQTLKVWNPYDGSVLATSKTHKSNVLQTLFLSNGDLVTATFNEICTWK